MPLNTLKHSLQSLRFYLGCLASSSLAVAPLSVLALSAIVIPDLALASEIRGATPVAPPRVTQPPSLQPLPEVVPPPSIIPEAPPPLNTIPLPQPVTPTETSPDIPKNITVKQFQIEGPQVFSQPEIDAATKEFLAPRQLSFAELLQAADAIGQLYLSRGYIISGAYIPADRTIKDGIVPVRVIGDRIDQQDIRVRFVIPTKVTEKEPGGVSRTEYQQAKRHRLQADYIRSRLALATRAPLNRKQLLEALQLLQLNPLIQDVRANLYPGTRPGQSLLDVDVVESRSFHASVLLDNGAVPSIGTFRRQVQVQENNLSGRGDSVVVTYTNTDGSNAGYLNYTLPINPHNGTLSLNLGFGSSKVVEQPFDILNIRSPSQFVEFTYRQPIIQTPTQELALGVTLGHEYNKSTLVDGEIPFPVRGSDFAGKTNATPLRFFQEWRQNGNGYLFSARSQFSFGLPIGATENEKPPDGRFVSWQGQVQWVRTVSPDPNFFLLLRGNIQLADRALIPIEQFGLGGLTSVRGYRQDAILSDNGVFGSAELRVPVLRLPKIGGLLQVAPFADVGTTWNGSGFANANPQTLASVGVGLRFQLGNSLNARFDWGIPLIFVKSTGNTLQEQGLYFSLVYTPF